MHLGKKGFLGSRGGFFDWRLRGVDMVAVMSCSFRLSLTSCGLFLGELGFWFVLFSFSIQYRFRNSESNGVCKLHNVESGGQSVRLSPW